MSARRVSIRGPTASMFSPDGKLLLTTDQDTIRLWEID